MMNGATENIRRMQEASDAVKASTDLAVSAGESLRRIVQIANGTADKVHSIAVTAEEQSSVCEHITSATESINNLAEETLRVMNNADTAVAALSDSVRKLLKLTEELRNA